MTNYLQFDEQQTLSCYDIGLKILQIQCAPAVCRNATTSAEQTMASLVRYKKQELCLSCPVQSVVNFEKSFSKRQDYTVQCTRKSEICTTSTLKLIKMMLKCQVVQASSTCTLYYNQFTRL